MVLKPMFYKCIIAIALVVLLYFSSSVGVELDISDLLGGLLC